MRARAALAACLVVVAACDSFGTASDATPTTPDAGSVTDGGEPRSGDGAVSDGGKTFCQSDAGAGASLCADFDTGESPLYGFMAASPGFAFTAAPGHASPTAMHVLGGPANTAEQYLSWRYTGAVPTSISIRFELKISKAPDVTPSPDAVLARLHCSNADVPAFIAMKLRPNGMLKLQVGDNDDTDTVKMPRDTWNEVSFTWDLTGASYHVDGGSRPLQISSGTDTCEPPFDLFLGFSNWNSTPTADYEMTFDDVRIDVR